MLIRRRHYGMAEDVNVSDARAGHTVVTAGDVLSGSSGVTYGSDGQPLSYDIRDLGDGWLSLGDIVKYASKAIALVPVVGAPIAGVIQVASGPMLKSVAEDHARSVADGTIYRKLAMAYNASRKVPPDTTDEEIEVALQAWDAIEPGARKILADERARRAAARKAAEAAAAAGGSHTAATGGNAGTAATKSFPTAAVVTSAGVGFVTGGPLGAAIGAALALAFGGGK